VGSNPTSTATDLGVPCYSLPEGQLARRGADRLGRVDDVRTQRYRDVRTAVGNCGLVHQLSGHFEQRSSAATATVRLRPKGELFRRPRCVT
jgi:hypothetical protein